MIVVVVYDIYTRKVLSAVRLEMETDESLFVNSDLFMEHPRFRTEMFFDAEPIFYKDRDGDVCLKPYSFIKHSNDLYE